MNSIVNLLPDIEVPVNWHMQNLMKISNFHISFSLEHSNNKNNIYCYQDISYKYIKHNNNVNFNNTQLVYSFF